MCSVIAYQSPEFNEKDRDLLVSLFEESVARGRHSYGVAAQIHDRLMEWSVKHDLKSIIDSIMELTIGRPLSLIGHCRYSTSGDYKDHRNNQPIILGFIPFVFNGVIDMGTKAEMEKRYNFDMLGENDGEIFLDKLYRREDVESWVRDGSFSFAGAWIQNGKVWLLRNEMRPLWMAWVGKSAFAASTLDIIARSGFPANSAIPVSPGRIQCLTP